MTKTKTSEMIEHAKAVRTRLWQPPNAVQDKGLKLNGKAIERALRVIEQLEEQGQRARYDFFRNEYY